MTLSSSISSRPATRMVVVLTLALGLSGGLGTTTAAAPAQASVSARVSASTVSASTAYRALRFTASKRGAHYKFGAIGPFMFDCSGLTKWAYAHAGRTIPRTAAQQHLASIHVSRANARPGDLVFFQSRGRVYHMGMYAGAGRIWHSPKKGDRVRLSRIWTRAVHYGRVR